MFHGIQVEAAIRYREEEIRKAMLLRQVREAMALCGADPARPACQEGPTGFRSWMTRVRRGKVELAR